MRKFDLESKSIVRYIVNMLVTHIYITHEQNPTMCECEFIYKPLHCLLQLNPV